MFENDYLYEHYLPVTLRRREKVMKIKKVLQETVTAVKSTYIFLLN
jgi:hypothetical protein